MKKIEITKEILEDLIFTQQKSISEISKILNISKTTINRRFRDYGYAQKFREKLPSGKYKDNYTNENMIGRRFQKLLVIKQMASENHKKMWLCKCNCGGERIAPTKGLINNTITSCGCWRMAYNDIPGKYFSGLKRGAEVRNLEFSITIEDIWNKYIEQNKNCALTNIELKFSNKSNIHTASVDRINSKIGYVLNNIRIVHKKINMLKRDMEDSEFFSWCKKVTECQKE